MKFLEHWKQAGTQGSMISSTKNVYMITGVSGAISATLVTLGFIGHAFYKGAADIVFAGAVAGLWTAVFGFATSAQNNKARVDATQEEKK